VDKNDIVTKWEIYLTVEQNKEKKKFNIWEVNPNVNIWEIYPSIEKDVKYVIDIIGPKWALLITAHLARRTMRFGELIKAIPDINPKTLAQRLTELEENGIVTRKQYETIPPKVEYSLTEKGILLAPIYFAMCEWSKRYPYRIQD